MALKPTNPENLALDDRVALHVVAVRGGTEIFLDFVKNGIPLTREDLTEEFNDILDELFPS